MGLGVKKSYLIFAIFVNKISVSILKGFFEF